MEVFVRTVISYGGFQCSSASRKFLNSQHPPRAISAVESFQCSSASRKFLNLAHLSAHTRPAPFQCSSASRKFLNVDGNAADVDRCRRLSVLFSEPKIPQSTAAAPARRRRPSFQCSSASRKFLNGYGFPPLRSPAPLSVLFSEPKIPQLYVSPTAALSLSALSVLFSEPKIPQSSRAVRVGARPDLSVLFSEPKIPQSPEGRFSSTSSILTFSALQRAENSSIRNAIPVSCQRSTLSVLFSEPKIPQCRMGSTLYCLVHLSVLFSEPKIPQSFRSIPTIS